MKKQCPICKNTADENMIKLCKDAEDWIIESIKRSHPEWVQENGSCSKCLAYYKELGSRKEEV